MDPLNAPGNFAPDAASAADLGRTDRMLGHMAAEMAELPPATMRRMLPILHEARKELRADLLRWLANAPDGANRFTAQQMRVALLNLEESMATIRQMAPELAGVLSHGSEAAGELSIKHLRQETSRMANVFGESLVSPQIRAAKILTDSKKILVPRFRNSANRYAGNVLRDLQSQFGVGVAKGETFYQLTQRLRRLGGPRGMVALSGSIGDPRAVVEEISEGLFRRYNHWAQRVVRTEMSNAYNHHHEQGVRDLNDELGDEDDEYLLRWDARNDGSCPICNALDRTTVKVGEQFAPGIYRAPAHPNCLCRVGAWRKDWGDVEGEVGVKGPAPGPNAKGWPPTESGEPPTRKPPKLPPKPKPKPTTKDKLAAASSRPVPRKGTGGTAGTTQTIVDQMSKATIGKKGQKHWPEIESARRAMDQSMVDRGFPRNLERTSPVDHTIGISKLRRASGSHNILTGQIKLTTATARGAREFAQAFKADPVALRKAAKAGAKEYGALIDAIDESNALHRKLRRMRTGTPARDAAYDAAKDKFQKALGRAKKLELQVKTSANVKAYKQADAMSTIQHEVIHGYGPAKASSMQGAGLTVEEITTEVLARRDMRKQFGLHSDVFTAARGGYSGWIDPFTDEIAKIYGVDGAAARDLVDQAADKYKRISMPNGSPDGVVNLFADAFPGDNRAQIAATLRKVSRMKL